MTVIHRLSGLVAIAASATLIAAAALPTSATEQAAASVRGAVANGPCQGGGSVTLQAQALGGDYVLTATASNLPVDGRWRGSFLTDSSAGGDGYAERDFKVQAVNGAWSVTRTVPARALPYFDVVAFGPGRIDIEHGRLCVLLLQPAKPFAGVTWCHTSYQLGLTAVMRSDGRLVVRYAAYNARPGSHWSVTVAANERDSGTATGGNQVAGPKGGFRGRLTFEGQTNPRLRLTVVADGGQRCSLRIRRSFDDPMAATQRIDGSVSEKTTARVLRDLMAAQRSHLQQR